MSERDDLTEQVFHTPFLPRQNEISREEARIIDSLHAADRARNMVTTRLLSAEPKYENTSDEVQSHIADGARGLDFLLGLQRDVEVLWGRNVDPKDPEAVSKYIREVVLCATDELHEVLGEVNWKPWKDKRGIKDIANYREEMADVLHFILDLYLAGGLTGRDIIVDYLSKHYENIRRNSSTEYRAS